MQEHHATRLHWDLRLEHDGALASWAVPNGIPEDPDENRKAVHTEDHPLEYLTFEGDIPEGNYGAGKMTIWDTGTYEPHKWEPRKVVVTFHGERLQGRYALFQAGRSEKDWLIHRMDPAADPGREPMPEHVVPMMARLGKLPAKDDGWAYEIKWDGVRAIAYSEPGRLRLESRNLNDITAQYPELRRLNRALSSHSAVLDGEIVAFDADGRPSFERLQQRMHLTGEAQIRRRAAGLPGRLRHLRPAVPRRARPDGAALLRAPRAARGAWRSTGRPGRRRRTASAAASSCSRRPRSRASRGSWPSASTARTSRASARPTGSRSRRSSARSS